MESTEFKINEFLSLELWGISHLSLFDSLMNLLEKTLNILNKINYKEIEMGIYGIFSERVENTLGDKIREKLLGVIYKGNIKYDVLWKLNLLKYIENGDTIYLNYLINPYLTKLFE
ncbi:hypothetical protein LCGC14_1294700 [marine sediment metagenome]|uniref:Uncharacterized protein n=1 Tax=marine sediment metagenome TaxID=412755 RepID=A0A0F9KRM3_9ZZZZ